MLAKAVRVLAVIYLIYILLAVVVVMPAANVLAPWYMQDTYGRELRTDIILFNPFTFNAEVRGASLADPDGSPFASFERASVNLSLASLVRPGVVLDELSLLGLRLHLRRTSDKHFNFSDLLPPATPEPEQVSDAPIPAVSIDHLAFTAHQIRLSDETRAEPFRTHYEGIAINVTDLSTIVEEGKPYRISASAESGGELAWQGTVSIPAARSEGKLAIKGLSLKPLWRFAKPWLNFELREGQLSVDGDYRVSWADDLDYSVRNGSIELAAMALQALDPQQLADTSVTLNRLAIGDVNVEGREQRVSVADIRIDGLNVAGWSEGAQVSLADLFAPRNLPAPADQADSQEDGEPGPEWQLELADIRLQNSTARWRSEYTDPAELTVSPLEARIQHVSWPLQGDSPLSLALSVNDTTHFKLDGTLALGSGKGSLDYALQTLPLAWFNPNLPAALKAHITAGQVDVNGEVSLNAFLPASVELDGSISGFSGQMEGAEESLTRWDSVRWEQLKINLDERQVYLHKLMVHDYHGRLHIARDGSINASKIWQEEVGEKAEELAHELHLDRPWQVDIPEIFISGSAIDFQDESLPIHFRTVIGDINGGILNLSSRADTATSVDITGSVDGYAPVTLKGSAKPLAPSPALDLRLTFSGVDMVLLSPYSGTYAGYVIERGLLNLDLGYSLENDHLKGNNEVIIDQLKLGDKTDSDKAVDLPLQLALALLTDSNGVIDLKVPVEGEVDDPSFGLGSVIAGAVVNLITKAVTAPFALLGSLVGSEDDLQKVAIPTGSAQLSELSRNKLGLLHQALTQRPALTLVIRGQIQRESDRKSLQQAVLEQELIAAGLPADDVASRGPAYMAAVDKRFAALAAEAGDTGFQQRQDAVVSNIVVSDEQLRKLAQARAVAAKEYLVNELGLPADRAVIEQTAELDKAAQAFSGVTLDLEP